MQKIGDVFKLVLGIGLVYLILLVVMPFLSSSTATANMTMNATSNMSNYPGASGFLLSTPWILWFVPFILGIIWLVHILRSK